MIQRSKFNQEEIARKLEIDVRTLRRYQNGERGMPTDLYFKLILITKFYTIVPLILKELNRYWHVKKQKKGKKTDDDDIDENDDGDGDEDEDDSRKH